MNRILFAVTTSNALYSRILRWAMRSNINHSLVLYESSEWGGWWAVEINENGVNKIPVEKLSRVGYMECYECSEDLWPAMRATRDFMGERYDWFGLLGGLAKLIIYRLFRRTIKSPTHRDDRLFCSEYVAHVMYHANLPGAGRAWGYGPIPNTVAWKPETISPEYLQNFWQASARFKQVDPPPGISCEK